MIFLKLFLVFLIFPTLAFCEEDESIRLFKDSVHLYQSKKYLNAARYAFSAQIKNPSLKSNSYLLIFLSLIKSGYFNAASYFFIETLKSKDEKNIKTSLTEVEPLAKNLGFDFLRKHLILNTKKENYNLNNRSVYLYSLGKQALIDLKLDQAIQYLNDIEPEVFFWGSALQLRATAYALLSQNEKAINDFKECVRVASSQDLKNHCTAGHARTLYQMNRFSEAEYVYDKIQKKDFLWPEVVFEQAWSAFSRKDYNTALGKLVSYKSPQLSFFFNSEIDILRAQSYFFLCLYTDAQEALDEFEKKYSSISNEIKDFLKKNSNNLKIFYDTAKSALKEPLYGRSFFYQILNRFNRSFYFQSFVIEEKSIDKEIEKIKKENLGLFSEFIEKILNWRLESIYFLGGSFVKNNFINFEKSLTYDFEKKDFIKIEILEKQKTKLIQNNYVKNKQKINVRERGDLVPSIRNGQYLWYFNGEFWNDELGDYVFGLESECLKNG